jgi:hypothetical protein
MLLPTNVTSLLVYPCVTALRTRNFCSKSYWTLLSASSVLTTLDVLIVGQLLQQWAYRHEAANALLSAAEEDPLALNTVENALKVSTQPDVVFMYVRLALQLALIPHAHALSKGVAPGRRLKERDTQFVAGLVSSVSRAAFTYTSLRNPTMTALLSACAHTDTGAAGSGGVGMCARLAARTVLELASISSAQDTQGWGHLVLHFLMQHAASCHVAVMQLLASAAVGIAEVQARGLSDILLLLQKLLSYPHAEQQRAGLLLAGRVMRSKLLERADTDTILASMSRMPFQPSWHAAQHLYRAVMHASTSLPAHMLVDVLRARVRPAAVEAALVHCETDDDNGTRMHTDDNGKCMHADDNGKRVHTDDNCQRMHTDENGKRMHMDEVHGRQNGSHAASSNSSGHDNNHKNHHTNTAGDVSHGSVICNTDRINLSRHADMYHRIESGRAYVLTVHRYVLNNMSCGVRAASAVCELLHCMLMLEGGESLCAYAAAACEWDVEMPAQLWDEPGPPGQQVCVFVFSTKIIRY